MFQKFPDTKNLLLGKFQTDKLEGRFGKYRQLSGSHYHVSVTQVLESEKKLKILSSLKLKSSKFGSFNLKDFSVSITDNSDNGGNEVASTSDFSQL